MGFLALILALIAVASSCGPSQEEVQSKARFKAEQDSLRALYANEINLCRKVGAPEWEIVLAFAVPTEIYGPEYTDPSLAGQVHQRRLLKIAGTYLCAQRMDNLAMRLGHDLPRPDLPIHERLGSGFVDEFRRMGVTDEAIARMWSMTANLHFQFGSTIGSGDTRRLLIAAAATPSDAFE